MLPHEEFLNRMNRDFFQRFYDELSVPPEENKVPPRRQESHREREIMMVLAGNTDFLLNGGGYPAEPGDVFFMDHWVPHQEAYENIKSDFYHIWFHFHEKRLFAVLYRTVRTEPLPWRARSWEFSGAALAFLQERWDRLAEAGSAAGRREQLGSIVRILCEEFTVLAHRQPAGEEKGGHVLPWVKNYISMRYGRDCSMAELERLTGYNRFHLMRRFKAEYGMTVGEYINCVRRGFVAAAAHRMRQKEIAEQLGFRSAAAFWLWRKRDRERAGRAAAE